MQGELVVGEGFRILKGVGGGNGTRRSRRGRTGQMAIEAKPDDDMAEELAGVVAADSSRATFDQLVEHERAVILDSVPLFLADNSDGHRVPVAIVKVPGVDTDRNQVFHGMQAASMVVLSVTDAGPGASGTALLRALQTRSARIAASASPILCIEDGDALSGDLLREVVTLVYNARATGHQLASGILIGVGDSAQPVRESLTIREIAMVYMREFTMPPPSEVLEKVLTVMLPPRASNVLFGADVLQQLRQEFIYSLVGVRHSLFLGRLAHFVADGKALIPALTRWYRAFDEIWTSRKIVNEDSLSQLEDEVLLLSGDDEFKQFVETLPSVTALGGVPANNDAIFGWMNEWLAYRLLAPIAEDALLRIPFMSSNYSRLGMYESSLNGLPESEILQSLITNLESSPTVTDELLVTLGGQWEDEFMEFAALVTDLPELSTTHLGQQVENCIGAIRSMNHELRERPTETPLSPDSKNRTQMAKAALLLRAARNSRQMGNLRFEGKNTVIPGTAVDKWRSKTRRLACTCIQLMAGLAPHPEQLVLHELFYFNKATELLALRGVNELQPRSAVVEALSRKDCPMGVAFDTLKRFGRTANVNQWFLATVAGGTGMSKNAVKGAYCTFARSVKGLGFCGIIKKSTRRTDHVDRIAYL